MVVLAGLAAMVVLGVVAGSQIDGVRWRALVVGQKAAGQLDDLSWGELIGMLKPGSGFYLRGLLDSPNPYAVIRNPFISTKDIMTGQSLFESNCMVCHGAGGAGGTAPNISTEALKYGDSDWSIYRTLTDGVQGTAMLASPLNEIERWQVTGYVLSFRQANGNEIAAPVELPDVSVPFERIVNAADEPHNWLTYSGAYNGQRHSALGGINKNTIDRLGLKWVLQTEARERIEASPIVVDGVMYLTLPEGIALAVDAATGAQLWHFASPPTGTLSVCCGRVNRGAAILDDTIYTATLDNRLQALSAKDGELLWETVVADKDDGYTITVAPLALNGRIIVGVSGGEYGIRGFLDAYDPGSGERIWRFHTTPAAGEPGSDSWSGDSWRTGGGPTWVTGSYDVASNTLYWGTGNPSPDFDGSRRQGDNLYTNSVVALDADTGELRWYFQFTPHDLHDFAANQIPVLVDMPFRGEERALMLWANRNGFFYALDRTTGEYLGSLQFAKQNWTFGIDENGRPDRDPNSTPTPRGTLVWPGASGATNWPPPTFSPTSNLFYVPRLNRPSVFFVDETPKDRDPPRQWLGGASTFVPGTSDTALVAIDPQTLSIVWETPLENIGGKGQFSGALSVEGLVFVAEGQSVYAADDRTGEILWSSRLGGPIGSPPTTYAVGGTQYLTVAAGKNIYAFGLSLEQDQAQDGAATQGD